GSRARVPRPAGRAEVNAALIERVDGHGVAQHIHVAVLLRQALREGLPLTAAGPAAVYAQLAVGWKMLGVALDGHDVDSVRLVRVNIDNEAEIGGQVAADFLPRITG